jgi:hypothetical protein
MDSSFSDEEIARRRDAVIKHMLNTPPKPHKEMKLGKRKPKKRACRKARAAKESKAD